jgi:hypothetical protein
MSQITKTSSVILDQFYKKLTVAEFKTLGFRFFVDRKDPSTTLRSKAPFLWSHPDVLEECLYKEQLLDALEQCDFDGEFFTVIAHGVLAENDVFPFAIFQINATEKPIDLSTPSVREMAVPEQLRQKFEESVFSVRFIGSIERTGNAGDLYLQSIGCPAKADLLRRTEDGMDYCDETVSAMWYGFKLALLSSTPAMYKVALPQEPYYPMTPEQLLGVRTLSSLARAVLHHMLEGEAFVQRIKDYNVPSNPFTELYGAGFCAMISSRQSGSAFHFGIDPSNRPVAAAHAVAHGVKHDHLEALVDCLGTPATLPPLVVR